MVIFITRSKVVGDIQLSPMTLPPFVDPIFLHDSPWICLLGGWNKYVPQMCHGQARRVLLGMGDLPPFNRNPYSGYIKPYYGVDEFIPYNMEIMGVDRPWHKW